MSARSKVLGYLTLPLRLLCVDQVLAAAEPALDVRARCGGMAPEHLLRRLDGPRDKLAVALEVGEAQQRLAALPLTEVLARPAQLEIPLRDFEAVCAFEDHLQSRSRRLGQRLAIQQDARALARAAADTAAQLVELCETEALGALDHHERSVGHVHADLDDGGADKQIGAPGDEIGHHRRLLRRREAPVQKPDAQAGQFPGEQRVRLERRLHIAFLRLLDHRAYPVSLLLLGAGGANALQKLTAARCREKP